MIVIEARNVNDAFYQSLQMAEINTIRRKSRNGDVLQFKAPVTIEYKYPVERVLFDQKRDANPFFHFAESLWMLAGRNDVELPAFFVKTMGQFSDDGVIFNGAYGYRWRHHFQYDQLRTIIAALRDNPDCRRQVLSMWDPYRDLGLVSKDLPCNLSITFQQIAGYLNMVVFNRSNDLIWGALGANVVHFSMLHEFVARATGLQIGTYHQVSSNMHIYLEHHAKLLPSNYIDMQPNDRYVGGNFVLGFPMMYNDNYERWLQECELFLTEGIVMGMKDPFWRKVAQPIFESYRIWRNGNTLSRYDEIAPIIQQCSASDWKVACIDWLNRRMDRERARNAGD